MLCPDCIQLFYDKQPKAMKLKEMGEFLRDNITEENVSLTNIVADVGCKVNTQSDFFFF